MPYIQPRRCNYPSCKEKITGKASYCPEHSKLINQQYEKTRETATKRGYNARWHKTSKAFLEENPVCVIRGPGCTYIATETDHIEPHKGNKEKFWDKSNFQPVCKRCHSRKTAEEDGRWGRKQK